MRISWYTGLPLLLLGTQLAFSAEPLSAAKQNAGIPWSTMGIAGALAVVAMLALVWVVRRFFFRGGRGPQNAPRLLLHELCQAHGLSRRAERLLRTTAAAMGTPHPGRFFLEPSLLLEAQKNHQLRGSRRALGLLYESLFGENVA